jgi:hypothetical protein
MKGKLPWTVPCTSIALNEECATDAVFIVTTHDRDDGGRMRKIDAD